jgi:hypothetical protein
MIKILTLLLIIQLLSNCVVVNINGLKSGYKTLTIAEKTKIVDLNEKISINDLSKSDTIYRISSKSIESYIENLKGELVVYLWSPNCSSSYCYSIDYVQKMCRERNQKLIVLVEYFDMNQIRSQNLDNLDFPLFSINSEFYRTDFCNKYVSRFFSDLLNIEKVPDEILYKNYFLFDDGKFVKSLTDIVNL